MNIAVNELVANPKSFSIAPAGCGKTETIIDVALQLRGTGKQLILTHTHAGVHSIKKRAFAKRLTETDYDAYTIDSFCREWVFAYPSLCQYDLRSLEEIDWLQTRLAFSHLLKRSKHIRDVISLKWQGLIVDEYQDCSQQQHEIILELTSLMPCRILGDPLQGLYDFEINQPSVDWENNVANNFVRAAFEAVPARWQNTSPELGNWLLEKRKEIIEENKLSLTNLPRSVTLVQPLDFRDLVQFCIRFPDSIPADDSVLILHHMGNMCHHLASKLRGRYRSIEELACEELVLFAKEFDTLEYDAMFEKLMELVDITSTGMGKTGRQSALRIIQMINTGRTVNNALYRTCPHNYHRLAEIQSRFDKKMILETLEILSNLPGVITYRRELWHIATKAFVYLQEGKYKTLLEAVNSQVNQYRSAGRFDDKRIIGRIRLVKGLEYDHVIVVDFEKYASSPKGAYVALTRAKKSLTVISNSDTLSFEKSMIPSILI